MEIGSLTQCHQMTLEEAKEAYRNSKGTIGYYLTPKRKEKGKFSYYALKAADKVTRPIIHAGDAISKGVDYVGDKIMSTKAGRKAHEYLVDPRGEHPVAHGLITTGLNYAANRAWSRINHTQNSKLIKGIDAGTAGYSGYKATMKSLKRGAMSKEALDRKLAAEKARDMERRKARDKRMSNFWKDMKN